MSVCFLVILIISGHSDLREEEVDVRLKRDSFYATFVIRSQHYLSIGNTDLHLTNPNPEEWYESRDSRTVL